MAIIKKIFLASSEELQEDRRAFEIMLARLNPQWRSREITFEIVIWKHSSTRCRRKVCRRSQQSDPRL